MVVSCIEEAPTEDHVKVSNLPFGHPAKAANYAFLIFFTSNHAVCHKQSQLVTLMFILYNQVIPSCSGRPRVIR